MSETIEEKDERGIYTGGYSIPDNANYYLSAKGLEIIEKKQHEFWSFVLPYGITTLIAISSVVAQIIDIFQ